MKNWMLIPLVAIACTLIFACKSNDPNHLAEDQLRDEVMVIHDEVMPKMGEIQRLRKALKNIAKSDELTDDDPISAMLLHLDEADEGMMAWMGEFKQPAKLRGSMTHEEIMLYLAEEKLKIAKVRDDMLSGIAAATEMVESYSKAQ